MYVQFGGFKDCPDGWTNFEPSIHLRVQRVPGAGFLGRMLTRHRFGNDIRIGDIVKGLPLRDQSAHAVFSSHVLEHLSRDDACKAIREVFRILRPGGIFRSVVPDLETRARYYVNRLGCLEDPAGWFMKSTLLGEASPSRSPYRRMANALFSTSAHKWMWDYASISKILAEQGFVGIRQACFGDNPDPMYKRVEKRDRFFWRPERSKADEEVEEFHELAFEAVKPTTPANG